jgi:hypothetical protein
MWQLVLCCSILGVDSAEADPTVRALAAGIEQRHASYRNIRFQYTVTRSVGTDRPTNSVDVFELADPDNTDTSRQWRRWVRRIENADDGRDSIVDRFIAFDGKQFAQYFRKEMKEGSWSAGVVSPSEDTRSYQDNGFENFLFWDINGIPEYMDPTRQLSNSLNREYSIVKTRHEHGRDAYVLEGRNPQLGVT